MMLKLFFVACIAFSLGAVSSAAPATAASKECYTRKTKNNGCCVFPFTYRNKLYYDCTTKNSNNEWCATTADYDPNQWGECVAAPKAIFDVILDSNKKKNATVYRADYSVDLFQGDILMDQDIINYIKNHGLKVGTGRTKRAAMKNEGARWITNGKPLIQYRIENTNNHARAVILRAMNHWKAKVPCLTFKPYRGGAGKYLSFFSGGGCYSMVGRQGNSGAQKISIGRGCEHLGVIAHEIGHALGFWHEQSRPDRDQYVTIKWGNIKRGMAYNFHKYDRNRINSRGIAYDYNSLMHYSSNAFSNGRGATIVRRDGGTQLGQRYGLSAKDIQQANLLYCGSGPRPRPPTPPPPPPTPPPVGCPYTDKKYWCSYWKNQGLCTSGRTIQYMKLNCQKSCKCSQVAACKDKDLKCSSWKSLNYCSHSRYGRYVRTYCRKSCGICR